MANRINPAWQQLQERKKKEAQFDRDFEAGKIAPSSNQANLLRAFKRKVPTSAKLFKKAMASGTLKERAPEVYNTDKNFLSTIIPIKPGDPSGLKGFVGKGVKIKGPKPTPFEPGPDDVIAKSFIDDAVNAIDRATKLPGKISDFGDRLNDLAIDKAKEIQNVLNLVGKRGGAKAKENLTDTKIKSVGKGAIALISNNPVPSVIGALLVLFLIFRGFK